MVIVRNNNGNGQPCSNKMKKHPYIMVVDREEEMVLILKHALELEEEEHLTDDSLPEESSIAKKIIRLFHKLSPMREGVATSSTPLSPRQTEILNQIAKGQPNKRIARTLGISEQTVKNHVTSIMDKLDANDRTHAVVLAMLNGWLNIQDVSEVRSEEELAPSLARS
jgi:DNA-binding NarL/FixJ family response regulator